MLGGNLIRFKHHNTMTGPRVMVKAHSDDSNVDWGNYGVKGDSVIAVILEDNGQWTSF